MEKWLTIDEYMDTFLAFLSTIGSLGSLAFVGMGYYLAKDYLKQHREKVKEEHKQRLIIDAIKTITRLKSDSVSYYAIMDNDPFDDSRIDEIESHVRYVIKRHRSFGQLNDSILESHFELTAISKVLNNNQIDECVTRFKKLLDVLDGIYRDISGSAFEHDWEGAYESIKTVEFYRNYGNEKAPVNLLISLLSLLIEDLLIIYWAKD